MIKSALIGKPVNHSVSDIMYEYMYNKIEDKNLYKHYKLEVSLESLKDNIEKLRNTNFIGLNITLPYKCLIRRYIDSIDSTALEVGAVNTISIKNGNMTGYNTDWYGIYKIIDENYNHRNKICCIFGTGGASRAAIYAVQKFCSEIYVFYRDSPKISENTKDLFNREKELNIKLLPYKYSKYIIEKSSIIINTTSTGMKGNESISPFKLNDLTNIDLTNKLYIDAVFNPVETCMLKYFKKKGAHTVDGLWMMIYQGIKALSIWSGKKIEINNLNLKFLHELLERNIK